MGDPGVRAGDGGECEARRAAQLRGVDRLRRLRRASLTSGARRASKARRAEGDGLEAKQGAALAATDLERLGLSRREIRELFEKLADTSIPDTLDLSRARPAEEFAARFAEAVPKVDKPPTESLTRWHGAINRWPGGGRLLHRNWARIPGGNPLRRTAASRLRLSIASHSGPLLAALLLSALVGFASHAPAAPSPALPRPPPLAAPAGSTGRF